MNVQDHLDVLRRCWIWCLNGNILVSGIKINVTFVMAFSRS